MSEWQEGGSRDGEGEVEKDGGRKQRMRSLRATHADRDGHFGPVSQSRSVFVNVQTEPFRSSTVELALTISGSLPV